MRKCVLERGGMGRKSGASKPFTFYQERNFFWISPFDPISFYFSQLTKHIHEHTPSPSLSLSVSQTHTHRPGVNFINVKPTNFSYERCFSSYVLALSKNSYEKRAQKNVDEIDTCWCVNRGENNTIQKAK